ncbi:MAG: ribonuclease P protein component [Verrucomicrobiaceae bacterium]|nr:ribonuclease P protein component [Verrucomicrobiaceae bacterium]
MRLPSRLRMKASSEFSRLKEAGTTFPGRFLVLSAMPDTSVVPFRFGLVTSRKVGGAVTRNTVRRRLREVIKGDQVRIKPGWLFVVIARWKAGDASLTELKQDWSKLALRAGMLSSQTS